MIALLPLNLISLPEFPLSRDFETGGGNRAGHRPRGMSHFRATDEKKFMKQTNYHNEEMTRYRDPLMGGGWHKRSGYPAINYNDRSPEVGAMNAHLRASAYAEQEGRRQVEPASRLTNGVAVACNRMRSFLHLGRQYDTKARDNFVREAIIFALLVTLSAWIIISAVQALAARS